MARDPHGNRIANLHAHAHAHEVWERDTRNNNLTEKIFILIYNKLETRLHKNEAIKAAIIQGEG